MVHVGIFHKLQNFLHGLVTIDGNAKRPDHGQHDPQDAERDVKIQNALPIFFVRAHRNRRNIVPVELVRRRHRNQDVLLPVVDDHVSTDGLEVNVLVKFYLVPFLSQVHLLGTEKDVVAVIHDHQVLA